MIENFIGTKSWRKILEGLKRKVGIFIRTKNIIYFKKNVWDNNFNIFHKGQLKGKNRQTEILFYFIKKWWEWKGDIIWSV